MEKTIKLLNYNTKRDRNIFLLCWLAYSASYICRLNYSAVIPELLNSSIFTESRIASISSAFFICYGTGQIISGIIGDRVNTRYMIFAGTLLSALSNIIVFFFHSYHIMLILWAFNGIIQSLIWSPILKLASVEYDEKTRQKFGINMATTVPVGTVLSYAISLITMIFLPWKFVFLICGIILLTVSLIWITGTGKIHLTEGSDSKIHQKVSIVKSLKILISAGTLIFIVPIIVQGTLKDSVTQWIPEFFSSQFELNVSFSLVLTMVLPAINVTGSFFAKAINKRLNDEQKTSAVFFAVALVFLLILLFTYKKVS